MACGHTQICVQLIQNADNQGIGKISGGKLHVFNHSLVGYDKVNTARKSVDEKNTMIGGSNRVRK
jgi:hypothetical protein